MARARKRTMESSKGYFTSDLTKLLGIGRNTLRLYEEMGLLSGMGRTLSGYREYSEKHLRSLKFILAAKKVGFTLNEIKTLLSVVETQKNMTCGTISKEIKGKVQEIETEILILIQKKEFLGQFLNTCESNQPENTCDVINAGFESKACCK